MNLSSEAYYLSKFNLSLFLSMLNEILGEDGLSYGCATFYLDDIGDLSYRGEIFC